VSEPATKLAPASATTARGIGGEPTAPHTPLHHGHGHEKPMALALAALGIVFGDIGTSPLYAVNECFHGEHGVGANPENVLGVLSLFFWSLTMVVTVKYIGFIMRADNKGEGGIFALLALVPGQAPGKPSGRLRSLVVLAALFGAALLYGDGVITPAISVLGAVDGLKQAPLLKDVAPHVVVPLTVAILVGLFWAQKRGTDRIGKVFGPVMCVWFAVISALGIAYIIKQPHVLYALNPEHAVSFFITHGVHGFTVLGSVVLCITGGEALYADMGHFGAGPIRKGWFAIVFPALLLNYFGQGALLLSVNEVPENVFYAMVPSVVLVPMVLLATAAAVIASQALISGAFSLTRQAVQLGYCPRVTIVHTSRVNEGQIYIPEVNRGLGLACIVLVIAAQSATKLAAAYGIAVTGTMAITSIVFFFVARQNWRWPLWKALPPVFVFLVFDVAYFGSNLVKFMDGGWFPIAIAVGIFAMMTTWKDGRTALAQRFAQNTMPLSTLLDDVAATRPHRVKGTAVFMSSSPQGTPPTLLHQLKHNQVLHEKVVILSIVSVDRPFCTQDERLEVQHLGNGFFRVTAHYGFMESPNVPELLAACRKGGLEFEPHTTSYFLGRETIVSTGKSRMWSWRKAVFTFLSRNARTATAYFGIPPGRVVELGMQVEL
jgi:KUP system potassium uptake protein